MPSTATASATGPGSLAKFDRQPLRLVCRSVFVTVYVTLRSVVMEAIVRRFVTPSILAAMILATPGGALAEGVGDQSQCRFRVPEFQPLNYRLAIFWAVAGADVIATPALKNAVARRMSVTDAAAARTMKQTSFISSIVHGGGKRRGGMAAALNCLGIDR